MIIKNKLAIVIICGGILISIFAFTIFEIKSNENMTSVALDKCVAFHYGKAIMTIKYPLQYTVTTELEGPTMDIKDTGDMIKLISTDTQKEIISVYAYRWIDEKGIAEGLRYKKINQKISGNVLYIGGNKSVFQEILIPMDIIDTTIAVGLNAKNQTKKDKLIISRIIDNIKIEKTDSFIVKSSVSECNK